MRRTLIASTLFLIGLSGAAKAADAPPPMGSQLSADDNMCLMCHGERDFWDDDMARMHIAQPLLDEDAHWLAGVNCHDCHGGDPSSLDTQEAHAASTGFRRPAALVTQSCAACHASQSPRAHAQSAHAKAGQDADGQPAPLECAACHGEVSHHLLPRDDLRSPLFVNNQIETCGVCHEKSLASYEKNGHGHGLLEAGLLSTATCADCHGAHDVYTSDDERSWLHESNVSTTCGACHHFLQEKLQHSVHGRGVPDEAASTEESGGSNHQRKKPTCISCHEGHEAKTGVKARRGEIVDRCGNCHSDLYRTFNMSTHGQLTQLGYAPAAACSDCHGAHDVLPADNPASSVAPANRLATCQQCHVNAVANFARFDPHADHTDASRSPTLHYIYVAMEILLYSVFAFFGVHSLVWLLRSLLYTARHGRPKRLQGGGPGYVRFEPIHRLLHLIVIVSFLGLAITGMPLRFSDQPWAAHLAASLGGFRATSTWHHILAIATFGYFGIHLVWLSARVARRRRDGAGWSTILFGPDSPAPGKRDVVDFFRMGRWFCGLGPKPVFERWTYWEKFDYWAVFWGVAIIGVTGLMLWLPNLFCLMIPGEWLNAAKVIHSEEALLAVGFIFAIHFFHNVVRPEKAPLDLAMFSGMVSEEELQEERPEYHERLAAEGKLDQMRGTAPSTGQLRLLTMAGWLAVAVGVALLFGILRSLIG